MNRPGDVFAAGAAATACTRTLAWLAAAAATWARTFRMPALSPSSDSSAYSAAWPRRKLRIARCSSSAVGSSASSAANSCGDRSAAAKQHQHAAGRFAQLAASGTNSARRWTSRPSRPNALDRAARRLAGQRLRRRAEIGERRGGCVRAPFGRRFRMVFDAASDNSSAVQTQPRRERRIAIHELPPRIDGVNGPAAGVQQLDERRRDGRSLIPRASCDSQRSVGWVESARPTNYKLSAAPLCYNPALRSARPSVGVPSTAMPRHSARSCRNAAAIDRRPERQSARPRRRRATFMAKPG